MRLTKNIFLFLVCLSCLTATISAQKYLDKPFQKWSKEEALKVLTDSPWVETYQSAEGLANADREQIARSQADQSMSSRQTVGSAGRTTGQTPVVVRLHSALPVRQALVRLQQIEAGYDKWDDKKRADFDAARKNLLECPICKDYYVVTMTKFLNSSDNGVQDGLFQTMKSEDLKGNIWLLNDKGEKRDLREFTPPKGARDFAIFFFPRRDANNNDLLTSDSKDLKIVFDGGFLNKSKNPYAEMLPANFDFRVPKLLVGDKIEF